MGSKGPYLVCSFLFLWDGLLVLGQVVDIDAFWYRRTNLGWIGLVSRDIVVSAYFNRHFVCLAC